MRRFSRESVIAGATLVFAAFGCSGCDKGGASVDAAATGQKLQGSWRSTVYVPADEAVTQLEQPLPSGTTVEFAVTIDKSFYPGGRYKSESEWKIDVIEGQSKATVRWKEKSVGTYLVKESTLYTTAEDSSVVPSDEESRKILETPGWAASLKVLKGETVSTKIKFLADDTFQSESNTKTKKVLTFRRI